MLVRNISKIHKKILYARIANYTLCNLVVQLRASDKTRRQFSLADDDVIGESCEKMPDSPDDLLLTLITDIEAHEIIKFCNHTVALHKQHENNTISKVLHNPQTQ